MPTRYEFRNLVLKPDNCIGVAAVLKQELSTRGRKARLDAQLYERKLASSREQAKRMIMAGEVSVEGQVVTKPGAQLAQGLAISIKARPRFVSRGGEKLASALSQFGISATECVCADVGASTGGFTDCLLKAGAKRVYSIDVGYGQLDWRVRQDPRVIVMERTNARYLEALPEPIEICTIDASFISLRHLLPTVRNWLSSDARVVALIKPQFEAGRHQVGKGGVVKDPEVHCDVIESIVEFAKSVDLFAQGIAPSPLKGPSGNIEFFVELRMAPQDVQLDLSAIADVVLAGHNQFA